MKLITVSKINHRDQDRLKLDFAYSTEISGKIKQIKNAAWSKTHKSWHIPFTKEAYQALKAIFPELVYPELEERTSKSIEKQVESILPPEIQTAKQNIKHNKNHIKIEVIGRKIVLKMPKNEIDIIFIRTLKYCRWIPNEYFWEIPNYPGNLELIKNHFRDRITELIVHEKIELSIKGEQKTVNANDLLIIKTKTGRLKLIFAFNKDFMNFLKKYPYHSWDSKNKWWTIPFSDKYLEEIKVYAEEKGIKLIFEEELSGTDGVKRVSQFDIPNYRTCPEEMILKLREIRYSEKTVKSYKAAFEEFMNYYHRYEVNKIDEQMIIKFLRYLVMERKVSTSYQNISINAIKFYYEKVLGGQRKFYFIDRPKKEKTLPTVLNEEEVKRLFANVDNVKHKCILMLAYSAGLRLGEIVRLRLIDIDRERMQIRVEQSKGKKDRYTKLAVKFIKVLDQYLAEYKPKEFVFEGATGGEYSPSSIQNTIKAVSKKAKIEKNVTMHTLRHTFGTHCLENGVDLRYIQSLMGHESSKTTEIYTHVTTKGFDSIKSPLDNLDI